MQVGVALSGGGARCVAQLGVLAYLNECGIEGVAFSGSSGGSIIGALLASGRTPEEILSLLKEIDFRSFLRYHLHKGSIYSVVGAEDFLRKEVGLGDFDALKYPFFCTVVNFQTGLAEYKTCGDLAKLIVASAALTPVFAPVEYEGTLYIDGGFYDNLPALPLQSCCEKIVGINVNPMFESRPRGFRQRLYKSLFIMLNANIREGKRICDLFIEPKEMSRYSIFDTTQFDLFFDLGYEAARAQQDAIEIFTGVS